MVRKEALENEIALTRRKNLSLHFACYRYSVRSPNALRAALESGFPSARCAVRVVLFAPVEYLTYGIRSVSNIKRLVGADASVRPTLPQSISTTTPVWQSRICIAFCKSKNDFSTNQTTGKIQGRGAAAPFLVVLRGFAKGQGSHTNPAKRFVWEKEEQRNGRGLSAASGGQDEECGVCSDASPPLPSFLSTVNGAFFPMQERKRG